LQIVYNRIVEDISSHVFNSDISELLRFWESECDEHNLAPLEAFTRENLSRLWARLMILKRVGDDFEYLHYGPSISAAAGFDMAGKRASHFKGEIGDFFRNDYLECLSKRHPIYITHHSETVSAIVSWERLMVPLTSQDGTEHIACYNQPLDRENFLFDALMEANIDGVALYRPKFGEDGELVDMIYHMVNRHVCESFGMEEADIVGKGLCELFPGAETEALPYYVELLRTGQPCEFERKLQSKDRDIYLLFKATKIQDRVMTIATDITDLREAQQQAEQLLRQSNRDRISLQTLIDVIPMPMFRRDGTGRIDLMNGAYADLLGVPIETLEGKNIEDIYGSETAEEVRTKDKDLLERPGTKQVYERHVLPINGHIGRDVVFHKTSMMLDGDDTPSIVGAAVDVTEEKALRAELETLAATDPLTGIANRRKFMTSLQSELGRSVRYSHPVSLIVLDIDHFKTVNDTYGHDTGDEVIKGVADTIQVGTRKDVDLPARIGGEEFAVLLPETDLDRAFVFAERVRKGIEETMVLHKGNEIGVTVSIGIAGAPFAVGRDSPDDLYARADQALYSSKGGGRNRTTIFQDPARPEIKPD
jgi:diguanylate cyclase (GGDEF)-like protein/PAS domain S-box-containing protein